MRRNEVDDHKAMNVAIQEALNGIRGGSGGPFGAVLVKDGKIIASAHNSVLEQKDPTRHAEINAISLAAGEIGSHDLSGCVIYSTTEPCPMCFAAIHWARIERLVYGTDIEDVKKLGFNELCISSMHMKEKGLSPVRIEPGFMREECMAILVEWKNTPGTIVY
ncbi:MAG: nucleoside deaminase [Candidatus Omnitrophica bacterium]|nr:nucleoside deaminase [Candidatus Omnitrophota bacterium]MDD5487525.1 nucleoside deaminase [Candidatus Omnitrophota bacterium]